jgi:hypothetical protein
MSSTGADTQDRAATAETISPYPGLRPFERHERDFFFGRDRDAELLSNKIFASRLTLLFGQSGRGKSSLLRTLLIPQLEAEGARVFSFDEWAVPEPLSILVERLGAVLQSKEGKSVTADRAAAEPKSSGTKRRPKDGIVIDLLRRLTTYDPRPLVIVLDQFEELLLRHSSSIETARRELAALVRDRDIDLKILISLREEFLAALEPFRRDIPGLFDSTYRLERLSAGSLADAIVKPASQLRVGVDGALVETLIRDLGGESVTAVPTSAHAPGNVSTKAPTAEVAVELPMLQLLMAALWKEAIATKSQGITLDLYRTLGGWRRVLATYVEQVTPVSYRDRLLTARLLQHLAPSSGYKSSYSAEDLRAITGLDGDRIQSELYRLSRAGILRVREFKDKNLYELQHDSLIDVLAPWRDGILRRWKQTKLALGALGAIAILALGPSTFALHNYRLAQEQVRMAEEQARQEDERTRQITEVRLSELDKIKESPEYAREAPDRIDTATRHLLYEARGPMSARMERLAEILKRFEQHIPSDHGLFYSTTKDKSSIEEPPDEWPFLLEYSTQRNLHSDDVITDAEALFRLNWRFTAQWLSDVWGLPAPLNLKIKVSRILDREALRLSSDQGDAVRVRVPLRFGTDVHGIIEEGKLKGAAQEFFDHFRKDWIRVPEWTHGSFHAVPRWSLPVWRAASPIEISDGTGMVSTVLGNALTKTPNLVLSDAAVQLLMERLAKHFPDTVAEALAARGSRIRADLIERVKGDDSLLHLEVILDALARYRKENSADVAARLRDSLHQPSDSAEGWAPHRLEGPASKVDPAKEVSDSTREAFEQAAARMPRPESRLIRVYLDSDGAANVEASWNRESGMKAAIDDLRNRLARQFGIDLFSIRVRPGGHDWPVSAGTFRVALVNQDSKNDETQEIVASDESKLVPEIIAKIEDAAVRLRPFFITAESVAGLLKSVDKPVAEWLKTKFSITDLKLILRSIVAPDASEVQGAARSPGKTIRNVEWLLPALVFFEPASGLDSKALARALWDLQMAKELNLAGPTQPTRSSVANLGAGIDALLSGKIDEAQRLFGGSALRLRNQAAFVQAYAARFSEWRRKRIRPLCRDLKNVSLYADERLDLEDIVAGKADPADQLHSRLCLYADHQKQKRFGDARRVRAKVMSDHRNLADWTPVEAGWFGTQLFESFRSDQDDSEALSFAVALLQSAASRMTASEAVTLFYDIVEACGDHRRYVWCTEVLNRLADARPKGLALERAATLSRSETRTDAETSLRYLDIYERSLRQGTSPPPSPRSSEFGRLVRILAETTIESFKPLPDWARIEQNHRSFIASAKERDVLADTYESLIQLMQWQGRFDEAIRINSNIPPEIRTFNRAREAVFDGLRWSSAIATSQFDAIQAATAQLLDRAHLKEYEYDATLAALLSRTGSWREMARSFTLSDHPYRRLVAIIFHSFEEGESKKDAQEFLEEQWRGITVESWASRLRDGDRQVWYEMLLSYYLDNPNVDRAELLGALRDEDVFAKSKFATLPLPRRGMLCEFHFYDAIKAKSQGQRREAVGAFEAVLATGHRRYTEFALAKYLVGQEDRR